MRAAVNVWCVVLCFLEFFEFCVIGENSSVFGIEYGTSGSIHAILFDFFMHMVAMSLLPADIFPFILSSL